MPALVVGSAAFTVAGPAPTSIASRSSIYKQGFSTVGTTGVTSRHVMRVLADCSQLFLRYGNWGWGGADDATNDILVDACIETIPGGTLTDVPFADGSTARVAAPVGMVDSLIIPDLTLSAGDLVAVRTFYRGETAGAKAPNDWYSDTGNGAPWYQTGNHLHDANPAVVGGTPPYNNDFYYSPVGIYAYGVTA